MGSDFNKPVMVTIYETVLTYIRDNIINVATWFHGKTGANIPHNAKTFANNRFERYDDPKKEWVELLVKTDAENPYDIRVAEANHADTATDATNATEATNAESATSATNADNADKLGGKDAAKYFNKDDTATTPIPVENGGTNAVTKADARTSLGVYSTTEADDNFFKVSDNLGELKTGTAVAINTKQAAARDNLDVHSKAEINTSLSGKADTHGHDYSAPGHGHTASDITPSVTQGFVSDAEKATWNGKADAHTHNYFSHPETHPASVIAQDANNKFVSDAEKATWNGKANAHDKKILLNATPNDAGTRVYLELEPDLNDDKNASISLKNMNTLGDNGGFFSRTDTKYAETSMVATNLLIGGARVIQSLTLRNGFLVHKGLRRSSQRPMPDYADFIIPEKGDFYIFSDNNGYPMVRIRTNSGCIEKPLT